MFLVKDKLNVSNCTIQKYIIQVHTHLSIFVWIHHFLTPIQAPYFFSFVSLGSCCHVFLFYKLDPYASPITNPSLTLRINYMHDHFILQNCVVCNHLWPLDATFHFYHANFFWRSATRFCTPTRQRCHYWPGDLWAAPAATARGSPMGKASSHSPRLGWPVLRRPPLLSYPL